MKPLYSFCLIASVCIASSVFAGDSEPEYVSAEWGEVLVVDKEATAKKKAATGNKKAKAVFVKSIAKKRCLSKHVPMGPIGGFVRAKSDSKNTAGLSKYDHVCPDLTVVNLVKYGPGDRGGLKIGDMIYGANGKAFTPMDWAATAGRKGAFRDLGLAIEDSEENRKGLVTLMLRRSNKPMVIKVQLPPVGGLSKTYPYDCPKSMKYYDRICDHLVAIQRDNGSFGTGIMGSSVAGLALLGHGGPKYMSSIERVVDYIGRKETMKAGCYAGFGTTWQIMYQGVFLAEYYLVTGNKRVLPVIQHLADVAGASMYNRMENKNGYYYGTFGHYINPDMDAQETVYKMSVITAGIAWSWALASQAGVDVPIKNWDAVTYHINRATGRKGGMGYCGPGDGPGSHPGVSNSMLALSCAVKDRRRDDNLAKLGGFLSNSDNFGAVMVNHGVTMTPFYTSSIALCRTNKKAYRDYMDYWKWFVTLTRGPNGYAVYWDLSGGGGDVKLGPDPFMNGVIGIIMAAGKGRLFMYGGASHVAGISTADLSRITAPVYKLIEWRRMGMAHKAVARAVKAIAVLEKRSASLEKMGKTGLSSVIEKDQKMIDALRGKIATLVADDCNALAKLDDCGDVYRAKLLLVELKKRNSGVPAFDDMVAKYEKLLRADPRKTDIALGRKFYILYNGLLRMGNKPRLTGFKRSAARYSTSVYGRAANAIVVQIGKGGSLGAVSSYFHETKVYEDAITLIAEDK